MINEDYNSWFEVIVLLYFFSPVATLPNEDINNLWMAAGHVAMVKEIADRVLLSSGRSLKCDPSSVKTTSVNCAAHLSTLTLWYIEVIPSGQWKQISARIWLTGQSQKKLLHILWKTFQDVPSYSWESWFHSNHRKSKCSKIYILGKCSFKRNMVFMKV